MGVELTRVRADMKRCQAVPGCWVALSEILKTQSITPLCPALERVLVVTVARAAHPDAGSAGAGHACLHPVRQERDVALLYLPREEGDPALEGHGGVEARDPVENGHGGVEVQRDVILAEVRVGEHGLGWAGSSGIGRAEVQESGALPALGRVHAHALGHVPCHKHEEARPAEGVPVGACVVHAEVGCAQGSRERLEDAHGLGEVAERVARP